MSEIKNSGLDQYGTEPFKQQQFGTGGVEGEGVKQHSLCWMFYPFMLPILHCCHMYSDDNCFKNLELVASLVLLVKVR